MFKAHIEIKLKKGVVDPEGKNIEKTLHLLGFDTVKSVHSQKVIVVELDAASKEDAAAKVGEMCKRLLTNPVTHDYTVVIS
ncbi:MAG: phosphoribosylformylglycinamidine synthase PurS protein [Thermoplasmata archaeon HGW-Thermoplasmata-1]|nr:MAG: phosphoribosylformylglycinamidine synthase PurS protein [Thermoplasmata archaeon HGW-Thermoplasmata-1]